MKASELPVAVAFAGKSKAFLAPEIAYLFTFFPPPHNAGSRVLKSLRRVIPVFKRSRVADRDEEYFAAACCIAFY
jgi:hypothetical protein